MCSFRLKNDVFWIHAENWVDMVLDFSGIFFLIKKTAH